MERIDTNIPNTSVEIEGRTYAVAAKTVAVAERLLQAQKKCAGKPEYRLWLAEMEILLGRDAVKALFCAGKRENIDRMQRIYAGVCRAFERTATEIEAQQTAALAEIAAALQPINELLRQMEKIDGLPGIYRKEG